MPRILLLSLMVCQSPIILAAQAGRVERVTRGDTTFIRTTGNGLWGAPREAVEVLRFGTKPGDEIGALHVLAATPSGGAVFYDHKGAEGMILRIVSPTGSVVKSFGRKGEGPGEIRGLNPNGLVVAPDGSIALHDYGNHRMSVYAPDGNLRRSFTITFGGGTIPTWVLGAPGGYYVDVELKPRDPTLRGSAQPQRGFVRIDSVGVFRDTIAPPRSWGTSPAAETPARRWMPLPDGRVAIGSPDKVAVLIRSPNGKGSVLVAEIPSQPVAYLKEEQAEIIAFRKWLSRDRPANQKLADTLPAVKGAYKTLQVDNSGRIWLERYVTAKRSRPDSNLDLANTAIDESGRKPSPPPVLWYHEPPTYAAFRFDGTYLGEVRFPIGVSNISFSGDFAWGVVRDEDDVPILVKYRLPK